MAKHVRSTGEFRGDSGDGFYNNVTPHGDAVNGYDYVCCASRIKELLGTQPEKITLHIAVESYHRIPKRAILAEADYNVSVGNDNLLAQLGDPVDVYWWVS